MPGTLPTRPSVTAPPPGAPQPISPRCVRILERTRRPRSRKWNASEKPNGPRMLSAECCADTNSISLRARPLAERLRDHAYILDARLPQSVHHRRKAAERHRLVAADIHGLVRRIGGARANLLSQLVDVHRLIPQIYALRPVNRNNQADIREVLHRLGFGAGHLEST